MQLPFLVSDFKQNLVSLLIKQCFGASFPDISQKKQIHYLFNYLSNLDAKTVICESDYVDKDYLEDYSTYYVKCFSNYPSRCARLHFFDKEFSHENFRHLLNKEEDDELNIEQFKNSYLGFMVIKPLPMTFIGRTCLKVYSDIQSNGNKHCISRTYKANLFGIELEVNSIAFQEQDKVVSACATTSLWTLFHASAQSDIRNIPSPSEITLNALSESPLNINGFPNKGLTEAEVVRALEKSKIKHNELTINATCSSSVETLKGSIQAYIDSNIPLILGASIYKKGSCGKYVYEGEHAITTLGYQNDEQGNLNSIYVHDDRIGPYTSATLGHSQKLVDKKGKKVRGKPFYFSINVNNTDELVVPNTLIVGTYHKIRIPYLYIGYTCDLFISRMQTIIQKILKIKKIDKDIWEMRVKISLVESSKLKTEYFSDDRISNKYQLLVNHWPRFIWVASYYVFGTKSFDLLYDGTDIPQGNAFIEPVIFSEKEFEMVTEPLIKEYKEFINQRDAGDDIISESFFLQTLNTLKRNNDEFFAFLDDSYGDLRPPKYLKNKEFDDIDAVVQDTRVEIFSSSQSKCLNQLFGENTLLIWVISHFGSLLIGEDKSEAGHPTLTGSTPARIGGEIRKDTNGTFTMNFFSGRYSNHYSDESKKIYLKNARAKFLEIFPKQSEMICIHTDCL
jgi:hypothetical protein